MTAKGSGSERPAAADRALLSAFDNAPIGMAVLTPDGVITACNTAVGRLLGRPTEELVGGTFFDFTHADDLSGALANCKQMQAGGSRILRHECRFLRVDGAPVWVSISASRVPDGPDDPAHLIMHIEDINDRKNLEAELIHRAHHDPLTGLATAPCSPSGSMPSFARVAVRTPCSTSISTGSSRSTTATDTPPGTRSCNSSRPG